VSRFIDERRGDFGVEPICETLGVSASAYYRRATGQRSARVVEDERLLAVIVRVHEENYEAYGYRRMWKALRRAGETAPRCQVQRLMATNGVEGAKRRGKPWRTTIVDKAAQRSPDLVQRDFTADRPNALWVADFTYLRCWEGRLFFSFVLDVFSRMIVGWQLASNMRTTLVLDALRMALGLRAPGADVALVHHSDAGSQLGLNRSTQQCLVAESRACGGRSGAVLRDLPLPRGETRLSSRRSARGRAGAATAACAPVGRPPGPRESVAVAGHCCSHRRLCATWSARCQSLRLWWC
jgi:putative transposase